MFSSRIILIGSACLLAGVIAGWSVRDGAERIFDNWLPPGWERYSADQFSFTYPSSMQAVTPENPYTRLGGDVVGFMTDESNYSAINYNQDSWLVVSSRVFDEANCFAEDPQTEFLHEQIVKGIPFKVAVTSSAGAGNIYDQTLYRAYEDGRCYEIATTLHYASDYTNIDESAMAASQNAARLDLEQAVVTFQLK